MTSDSSEQKEATAEEKLELIRHALYSNEGLLKTHFRIMLIADPGSEKNIVDWFTNRSR